MPRLSSQDAGICVFHENAHALSPFFSIYGNLERGQIFARSFNLALKERFYPVSAQLFLLFPTFLASSSMCSTMRQIV